ncbi:helix-turn-helix transcriptional regulator [Micromonospora sp. CPCC 206060]|uniref:helix-turn-helix domain-containing protein n=1 Tax=Micromonospora sp. CPCC 206060 TaxID=3122406 RepID=UPI002FF349BB
MSPLVARVRLAEAIKTLRGQSGLDTQGRLGAKAGISRQEVNRLENPLENLTRNPDAGDIRSILLACNLDEDQPEHRVIMSWAWSAREPGWWSSRSYREMGHQQQVIAIAETYTSVIQEYQVQIIPGLMQTEQYAHYRAGMSPEPGSTVDGIVRGRLRRQQILAEVNRYEVVLEELAVRRVTAAPVKVMRDQLLHLLDLAERPNISIRVMPVGAPTAPGRAPTSPFSLYRYPDRDEPEMAVVDSVRSNDILVEPAIVREQAQLLTRLREAALSDADSAAFIRDAANALAAQ